MHMLPLPDRYDRFRLVKFILKYQIKKFSPTTQKELELITGVGQTSISRLSNPDYLGSKGKGQKNLSRKHILALTRKGLGMSHVQASLLLWLAGGSDFKPWREHEFAQLQIPNPEVEESRQVNVFRDDPLRAHAGVIKLLAETFGTSHSDASWHNINTNLLHGHSQQHSEALYRKLIEMEARPGQRMVVSKYPSILVSTDISSASERVFESSGSGRATLLELLKQRREIFLSNIERYGERAIHSVASLKRFVSKKSNHPLGIAERRKRVKELIQFIRDEKKYPHYYVGLIPEKESPKGTKIEPEVEIAIKSTSEVVIRGTARELSNHPETVVCGPNYLHWDNEWAVISSYLDFERVWGRLQSQGHTNRKTVLARLEKIIKEAGS